MFDVWNRVQQLQGQTLATLRQKKLFDIVEVRADRVIFKPHDGNGTLRWCERESIERLYSLSRATEPLSPSQVQKELPKSRNSSYIAAIIGILRDS